MRCSCRHCRFRKCIKVGMDCTELNNERRRKRRIDETNCPIIDLDQILDPLIKELVIKERQFLKILTSTNAPIHANIQQALINPSSFLNFEEFERCQMRDRDQMNFSYWRAKILSTVVEWAKSFNEFTVSNFKNSKS